MFGVFDGYVNKYRSVNTATVTVRRYVAYLVFI